MSFSKKQGIGIMLFLLFLHFNGFSQETNQTARDSLIRGFINSEHLVEKQTIYDNLIEHFPENSIPQEDRIYDQFKQVLAVNYLVIDDTLKFTSYTNSISDKIALAERLDNISGHWANDEELLIHAERLSALALDLNSKFLENPTQYPKSEYTPEEAKEYFIKQRDTFTDTYAYILHQQGDSKKAIALVEPLYENIKSRNGRVAEHYSTYLSATGNPKKANEVIEKTIIEGFTSPTLVKQHQENYLIIQGSIKDYDDYWQTVQANVLLGIRNRVKDDAINAPAPEFSLRNLKGELISLADYKGKVIVLDFWATWCGPCKAAFQGMNQLVNKYKDKPDVVFFFINTWENSQNYQDKVNTYIESSKFDFHVLFDKHDGNGKQTVVASEYKVEALPTKVILDKEGAIRFRETGYSGVLEDLLVKTSERIDFLLLDVN